MVQNKNNQKNGVVDYLLTKVPTVLPETRVEEVIELIRKKKDWETINYIYILDSKRELVGVVSIKELLKAKNKALVKEIMTPQPAGVSASMKQERAAVVAIKHNIKAVPILKVGTREFLGVIGTDKILDILHDEHIEDFLQFSGITKQHQKVDIFKAHPFTLTKLRLPWLLVGLVGGMIGAALVSRFESTLQQEIAMVFFIPVVVYISNAISIQTQALLIRLLASQRVKSWSFLKKELLVSFLLALISALVIAIFISVWLQSVKIALTVGLAIVCSTLAAITIAIAIPLILHANKKDPVLGSGPFSTAIQDIATLLIYLFIASLIIF